MSDKESRKLAAARTRLILDKPFLGALVMRLPMKAVHAPWCPTTATDARTIYYNPDFIKSLNLSQVQFVLAHDALHCGLSHFARREHRDPRRWNIACDHAVNSLLKEDKLQAPEGSLYNEKYTGLSAEEIFPLIPGDTDEETLDEHLYDYQEGQSTNTRTPENQQENQRHSKSPDRNEQEQEQEQEHNSNQHQRSQVTADKYADQNRNQETDHNSKQASNNNEKSDSDTHPPEHQPDHVHSQQFSCEEISIDAPPPPLTAQQREQLNIQWQQRLAGAAQQAMQSGKMSGSVARLVNRLLRSSIPWRTVLARYMSGSARVDYNLTRPSQRREGDAIMPSLHARQTNVVIALDTSGSIEQNELDTFVAEVNAIKSLVNARITLLACDSQLDTDGPWIFESWEQLIFPKSIKGSGGTDFSPVFEWLFQQNIQADLVIYFTDAQGRFPANQPIAETLWLVKGAARVPWGQRIQLN